MIVDVRFACESKRAVIKCQFLLRTNKRNKNLFDFFAPDASNSNFHLAHYS